MKKVYLLASLLILLGGCSDKVTQIVTYYTNEPVFMPAEEFLGSIQVKTIPQPIREQGKICFYEGYLFVSEPNTGIHIIDNQNPADPRSIGFIEITGNRDIAIKNNILYADAYTSLVWFDIADPANPVKSGGLENIFECAYPEPDNDLPYDYTLCREGEAKGQIVVGWTMVKREKEVIYDNSNGGYLMENAAGSGSGNSGVNGSMSRFGIYQDYLYTILNDYISIFSLSGEKPTYVANDRLMGWQVETIFPYKDHLFMGTPRGMLIYSVEDPARPEFISSISHVFGCDPVVVENDLAYVTIRSGNSCGQSSDELIIIDVSDVKEPKQIVSYTMKNPKGLGIENGTLFVCDDGLKVFKVEDPQTIMANLLEHYTGMDGYDVIPYNNTLMMIADDGIYQYDYSDLNNIKELSKLSIGN